MSARDDRGPIFVVGAPRSGTRLLAWSLGQHSAMRTVLDASWVGALTPELAAAYHHAAVPSGRSQVALAGTSRDDFFRAFGPPIEEALGFGQGNDGPGVNGQDRATPRPRWVDGTPENALHVYALSRVFPSARFIHVLRDATEVVRSLGSVGASDGAYFTVESAAEAWLRLVCAAVRAEAALGPEHVLRLHHRNLVGDPEAAVRRCLDFVCEPFEAACLRPLRGVTLDPPVEVGEGPPSATGDPESRVMRDALDWSRRLLDAPGHGEPVDGAAATDLSAELDARGSAASGGAGEPRTPLDRIRRIVTATVPEGATLLVVSRGDEELVRLPGRQAWHFPSDESGVYAGHHPADDRSAIVHLEELRERGADFLLLPCTSFWWLEHYEGFRDHLEARYRLVAYHEDTCLVFALRRGPIGAGVRLGSPER